MLETQFRGEISSSQMNDYIGKKVRMVGHLVTIKYIKTIKKRMDEFWMFHRF